MDAAAVAYEIRRVVRGQLDDCERAIKSENYSRALNELDDAVRKLKRIASSLG